MGNRKKTEEVGIRGYQSISGLEADIMHFVWEKKKITVREVHEMLLRKEMAEKKSGFTPYTTVMSTMSSLADRGFLKQDTSSKTYIYTAAMDSKELTKKIIMAVAEKLLV
ncbi:MAG: BlaI/MecI/CopY family transcriptional regulator [Actinobacteria bacterium]|nr:BlaI/MecI/CopY family transcriptional regulator [Actinomycetota bacterium]